MALNSFLRGKRRRTLLAGLLVAALLPAAPAAARGPEAIADVAAGVIHAVVNISTSQSIAAKATPGPQLPPGGGDNMPFREFFEEFFNRRGPQGENSPRDRSPRRVNSQGSGFIIDPSGLVVTNNHVISDADEVTVILNDGSRHKAEVLGRDQKTDIALIKVKTDKELPALKFGDSDKLRIGEWVIAIGNPFGLGGSVSAGIVSARDRNINSGPYDNYLQTDAAINRGNSGGPLFNLAGEVVGVNTAIYSPTGGSIGIGFAVPSNIVTAVIAQLREYGETRRGWLGVRIQEVSDEVAESLNVKPPRGALIAGIDDKGPAKPAGIERGDVIIKFDGKDIRKMSDLPRIVAETPVGKDVEVVIIRKGQEEKRTVTLGRLEDADKKVAAATPTQPAPEKSPVQRTLGLDIANLTEELRQRHKIKEGVKGVVITSVEVGSTAAEKQLQVGDVIVEIGQEAIADAAQFQARIDQLKKDGRKQALLLVSRDGDLRFVAVAIP